MIFRRAVRLPDEPLMLVDRVLAIEGVPRSMQGGRIVTEHVVRSQAWYLDAGRIVPSIAIEAGQADLLLCAYLGIDFETRGLAVYRLLDAKVTFHGASPREGDVIRYDICIDEFFRQGKTILFRFRLDATVALEPFLSMRDGCAGFFTPEELAAGRGIIPHAIDLRVPRRSARGSSSGPDPAGCDRAWHKRARRTSPGRPGSGFRSAVRSTCDRRSAAAAGRAVESLAAGDQPRPGRRLVSTGVHPRRRPRYSPTTGSWCATSWTIA